MTNREGREKLSCWFGLSRASWLTIPRVLMEDMPDGWQGRMAKILEEYDDIYKNQPDFGTRVQIKDLKGKLIRTPEWLVNYRRPDRDMIKMVRDDKS